MIEIKTFSDLEIFDEEDLMITVYNGVGRLLNVEIDRIRIISTEYDEDVNEIYYSIEGNGVHLERDNELVLCELDEVKFVLLEDGNFNIVLFRDTDVENVKSMF